MARNSQVFLQYCLLVYVFADEEYVKYFSVIFEH